MSFDWTSWSAEGLEFIECGTCAMCHKVAVGTGHHGSAVTTRGSALENFYFLWLEFENKPKNKYKISRFVSLPIHFFLLTTHSLTSETSGQGFPKGDGCWRTCLVRVSWPRLNEQVLPPREHWLHSLHSPTWQCTELRKKAEGVCQQVPNSQ